MKLLGDFDSASARELLAALRGNCANARKIFVHTNGIGSVHPSGGELFEKDFSLPRNQCGEIIFTGEKAIEIRGSPNPDDSVH